MRDVTTDDSAVEPMSAAAEGAAAEADVRALLAAPAEPGSAVGRGKRRECHIMSAAATSTPMSVGGWSKPQNEYFNRELSWLAFNARVLGLAADEAVPLLERVAFLAIFASNLDEFFQIRVAGLADRVAAGITRLSIDGLTAEEQLEEIRKAAVELYEEQQRLFAERIRPALAAEGIDLISVKQLSTAERYDLRSHFERRILPVLTPLAVDPGHPFPFISDLSLNLAVLMRDPVDGQRRFARVKVPGMLDRWVRIGDATRFVALEDVIAAHLDLLFPGMEVLEHHAFRVTRNADLTVDDEEAADLLAAVEMELRRRRFQWAVRLEVDDAVSPEVLGRLLQELDLGSEALYRTPGPVDLGGLFSVASLPRRDLRWPRWQGIIEPPLAQCGGDNEPRDLFGVLRGGDVLVHHPYSSFSKSVVELIRQAAEDPAVLAIKLTIYRTSGDSPIVDALIAAAEQGKQVAVLVELKARFDEAANISWAKRLEQAGAHVTYGLVGLKIHSKTAMIVREEPDGIRRYCHIGTGNYNPRTASVYEDLGLLTADAEVGADVASLFNQLTGYGRGVRYSRLIVAPEQLRRRIVGLIRAEVDVAGSGEGARIVMKMNALVDKEMIERLYEASQAGVEIDLIVRGQCCLRPGVPGLSERIRVRSIVGRYLEHSRIYRFANGDGMGCPVTYIGSADLMTRNLNRRVEALVRVDDEQLSARIAEVVEVCLADDQLAWTLDGDGVWTRCRPAEGGNGVTTHARLQELAVERGSQQRSRPTITL